MEGRKIERGVIIGGKREVFETSYGQREIREA
jgi:hypothetical protein